MKISGKHFEIKTGATSFDLQDLKGTFQVDIIIELAKELVFTIDIYAYMSRRHPEEHLGWWRFRLDEGKNEIEFRIDVNERHIGSVRAKINGKWQSAVDAWVNYSYCLNPLQDALLTIRKTTNELIYEVPIIMKIQDYAVLREFYHRLHREHRYTDSGPFLWIMHEYKLKILRKLFNYYLASGWKILDIGCGRSLFTEISEKWPFAIYAGDIEHALLAARKNEYPQVKWLVMDASRLPFKDNSFDAIFAGEIIEHMTDSDKALEEWKRILRPNGIAIFTTPNRDRFSNVVNKLERPFSPDHFREFSLRELEEEFLPACGFKVEKAAGTYLELLLKSGQGGIREDYLQREGNRKKNRWLMHVLNRAGILIPRYSLDLILVAKKIH
ncbi:MAG: hypothetical protein A2Y62_12965 [Candidatus Fischerbacteria bacterium RBG_13_37_8]|uniref:Methyltransferase type 11 domain-containing protein n=1 Tax=Candidatus Fischerbacteria bacterium RBG_13_37_8 TaxID=1817863 RepID=A0A1F5V5L9_9BACT|nr:MAG: hypothetical protein A2Y62_12965 [Candidatus Fischerbacteria bacterium RBG_13_37_8]